MVAGNGWERNTIALHHSLSSYCVLEMWWGPWLLSHRFTAADIACIRPIQDQASQSSGIDKGETHLAPTLTQQLLVVELRIGQRLGVGEVGWWCHSFCKLYTNPDIAGKREPQLRNFLPQTHQWVRVRHFFLFYLNKSFLLDIFFIYTSNAIPKAPYTLPWPCSPTHLVLLPGPGILL